MKTSLTLIEQFLVQAEMVLDAHLKEDPYSDGPGAGATYLQCATLIMIMESLRRDRMYYNIPYGPQGYPPPIMMIMIQLETWRKWVDARSSPERKDDRRHTEGDVQQPNLPGEPTT